MQRSAYKLQRARPCWPLFRKKCEACGCKFRWQRGIKWHPWLELAKWAISAGDTKKPTLYLCARCKPPSHVTTADGVERWVKIIKGMPPVAPRAGLITAEEAAKNFARAGAKARTRLEDIHIPRRSKKEKPK